jgi:2Fe-2S ferredoxin
VPTLAFIQSNGDREEVEALVGMSVMRAAVGRGVPGIPAECGGHLACGTCHVYVSPALAASLPPRGTLEEEMLGFAVCSVTASSRLSCQLVVTDDMDGAEFEVPPRQF